MKKRKVELSSIEKIILCYFPPQELILASHTSPSIYTLLFDNQSFLTTYSNYASTEDLIFLLKYAHRFRHYGLLEKLLYTNAHVNLFNEMLLIIVYCRCSNKTVCPHINMCNVLLKQKNIKPTDVVLRRAAYYNQHDGIISLLFGYAFTPNTLRFSFEDAVKNGNLKIIKTFVTMWGVVPTGRDLRSAAYLNRYNTCVYLLQFNTVIPTDALSAAVERGYTRIVQLLLEDSRTNVFFHSLSIAVDINHVKIVKLLLPRIVLSPDQKRNLRLRASLETSLLL